MLSLNASGFACSFDEKNIENLRHDKGGKKEFGNNRSRRGRFYNVLSCLHHFDPIRTFWTFTVPDLQSDYEKTDKFITGQFSKLLELLTKRHKRGKQNGLKNYVWVSEAQNRGNIHFHMVTSTSFINVLEVQTEWNKLIRQTSKNSVHVDPVDQNDIKNVSAYFAKYMSKANGKTNAELTLKTRIIFAKSFGYSRNFPIVDKISVHPNEILAIFPDMQAKKITKQITPEIGVDYYFFDSKTTYDFMKVKAEKERERAADIGFIQVNGSPTDFFDFTEEKTIELNRKNQ
jgi:hypothetical protein